MMRIYIFLGAAMVIVVAYFMGVSIGREKCVANMSAHTAQELQQKLVKKEKINAEVNRRTVADIRGILRAKYTIAE